VYIQYIIEALSSSQILSCSTEDVTGLLRGVEFKKTYTQVCMCIMFVAIVVLSKTQLACLKMAGL
jgi:hypothetical protein